MTRKGKALTISCSPLAKAGLERLANRFECKWGESDNISRLIEAIGLGELRILDEPDPTLRLEALEQDPAVQEYLNLKNKEK